jgi:hypothetical protein
MLAMQYSITLPASHDMGLIRRRIADKGALLDGFPGLRFKAYLYACRGADGPENLYAPFYVWHHADGMNRFLCGTGFQTLTADLGWPVVRLWSSLSVADKQELRQARWATRSIEPIAPHADLAALQHSEQQWASEAADDARVLAAVTAYDPSRWERVRLQLWRDEPDAAQRYRVGYVAVGA